MNRRHLIKTTGIGLGAFLVSDELSAFAGKPYCYYFTLEKPGDASLILNDHWERTYGDISWHKPAAQEILPWYFIEYNGKTTSGFGVKTGAGAFCSWQFKLR